MGLWRLWHVIVGRSGEYCQGTETPVDLCALVKGVWRSVRGALMGEEGNGTKRRACGGTDAG